MASALSAGASAAIKYSIAILGRAPTEAELNSFAAAYKGASATASEDAVAAAVVASSAGGTALRPGVFSATKQAQVILGNHGVTNADVVAYVASMIDGTNADAGKVAIPLGTVARVVANFFSGWTSTPSNPYNDVFMAGQTALQTRSSAAEAAVIGGDSGGAAPTTPTFTLTAGESVDEGKSTIVTLSTKNVASGETINYIISGTGIDENDVAALTGSATVGLDGKAYITVRALADKTTEGSETMTIMVGSASASVKINDLSLDQGKSITLTTAANSGADFTGGSADDMFQGVVTDAAATTTLSAGDMLDGGAGTDTLMVAVSGAVTAGQTATAFMTKNIEKVMVSNYETGANTLTFDMAGATGVTTLGISGSSITGDTVFANVLAKADIDMSNALGALTVTYPTAFVGTADTQKVSVSNVGQGATGTHNVAITVAGTEVFDITATGKNTLLGGITGGASTSVNTIKIGGAGSLTIGNLSTTLSNLDNTVKTVDASANTGGVSLTLGNGAQNVNVTGGAGNDAIRTGTHLTIDDTINGGDGTDTLIVDEGADVVTGLKVTNFETLRMVSGTGTVNMNFLAGMTAVDYRMAAAADGATVSNAPAAATVRISSDGGALVHGVKDANLVSSTADSLAVTLNTSAATPADVDVTSLTIEGIETLSIASSGAPATATVATDAQNSITIAQSAGANTRTLTSVTVTGSSDLSLALPASDKLTAVNAADFTGALTVTNSSASTTARTTITGGSGNDVITGRGAALADTDSISAGAGDDTISGGGGADFLDGGAGNDVITGNSLSTVASGNDTIKGGDGNDSIASGSGIDNIDGGAGDDAISFALSNTVAGVATGTLTSADVVDGGDGTDTVTFTGALTVASTLDLSSTTNTTFTGVKNVEAVVLATSTNALTVTLGDIALGSFNNAASFNNKGATAAVNVDAGAVLNSAASVTFTGTTAANGTAQGAGYTVGNNKDTVTFAGGADTLAVVTPTFLQATDSISGGTGSDTFSVANSASTDVSFTAAQLGVISSFETFAVNSTGSGEAAKVTFTLTDAVAVANAEATTGALTITRDASDTGGLVVNASALTNRTVAVTGGSGPDSLVGGAGNDSLAGAAGVDTLDGGAGNDILTATTVSYGESYTGGTGDDELVITGTAGGTVSLTGVAISGVEYVSVDAQTQGSNYTVSMRHDSGYSFAFGSAYAGGSALATTAQKGNVVLNIDLLGASTVNVSGVTSLGAGAAGTLTTSFSNAQTTSGSYVAYTLTGLGDSFTGNANVTYNLNGAGGNDTLVGGNNADIIDGGVGNDSITMAVSGGGGAAGAGYQDTLIGGSGTDTLTLSGNTAAGTVIDLSSSTDQVPTLEAVANTAPQVGFENVSVSDATTAGITITAASTGSVITGSSLVDTITGGVGADRIVMGYGTNTVIAEDVIAAGSGTDTLVVKGTLPGSAVTINLASTVDQYANAASTAVQTGFENLDATDALTGGSTVSITAATQGSQIAGSSQADSITGGVGNDSIYGAVGTDTVKAGDGTDTLYVIDNETDTGSPFTRDTGDVTFTTDADFTGVENIVISGNKNGTITVNLNGQTEAFSITSSISLGYRSNQVTADTPATAITAGAGADTITGSSLADTIVGGAGADTINSGAGNDNVTGGTGADVINVGSGTDTVVLAAGDTGTAAFTNGGTAGTIDAGDYWTLTGVDVISGLASGDTLTLPGTQASAAVAVSGTTGLITGGAAGDYALVTGTWDSTTGRFSYSATGLDTLVLYDNDGTTNTTNLIEAVVLVGAATVPTIG